MFGFFRMQRRQDEEKRVKREILLRQASAAKLRASVLMMQEMITLTAPREKVIEAMLEHARPNHPELTDKHILEVLEGAIAQY